MRGGGERRNGGNGRKRGEGGRWYDGGAHFLHLGGREGGGGNKW